MEHSTDIYEESHYKWLLESSFSCSKKYDQFINWLRTEFYFFQQDQGSFLTIYFPNGHVQVNREEEKDNTLISKITIESKCKKYGLRIRKKLSEFLDHIEKYNRLSKIEC